MEEMYNWLNSLININKSDYAEWTELNWLNPYNVVEEQKKRTGLLDSIGEKFLFKDTKPYYNEISKGCSICGAGKWSCLFITNKCNANCFYCPAKQTDDEPPGTHGLTFETAEDYAAYVNHFEFKGVSFSGGEPLLYFDRTLEYLKAVRKNCDPEIYIWMYTNGILADRDKFQKLADAGLNEVRFDIGATGFSLDKIAFAKGIIPIITIEIPAVPEETERMKQLLPEIIEAGVNNLNLHQLRLTRHNVKKLVQKGYTIIPSERPIVLESELAALEILNYAKSQNLNIGINYCSFHFKNRFQKAGFRIEIAKAYGIAKDLISENGYIRVFTKNSIRYDQVRIFDKDNGFSNQKALNIGGKNFYLLCESMMPEEKLTDDLHRQIEDLLNKEPETPPADSLLYRIWQLEYIERGLRAY
jgi:hypothetical protein